MRGVQLFRSNSCLRSFRSMWKRGTLKTKSWSKWVKRFVATGHRASVGNVGHNSSSGYFRKVSLFVSWPMCNGFRFPCSFNGYFPKQPLEHGFSWLVQCFFPQCRLLRMSLRTIVWSVLNECPCHIYWFIMVYSRAIHITLLAVSHYILERRSRM